MYLQSMKRLLDRLGANFTVLSLAVARFGDALGNSILFVVIPLFVAKLPAPVLPFPTAVRVGILISLFGLVNAFLQPVMGGLGDRFGRQKPMVLAGLAVMAAATLGFVLATRFVDLLFLRGIQGIGLALTVPASLALMARNSRRDSRGAAMGFYTTLRMAGFSIGPLLGGLLHDHASFNATFFTGGAFILLGFLLVLRFVREDIHEPSRLPPGERNPDRESISGESSRRGGLQRGSPPARRSRIIDLSLLGPTIASAGFATLTMAIAFSMITTLENQINSRIGQSASAFGLAFSAMMVSRLAFQIPLGRLSDRLGRKPLIVAGLLLMTPVTVLLGFAGSTPALVALQLFQGLGAAAIAAPAFALAGDLSAPGQEGRKASIVTMGFGLGIAVGPLIAGFLGAVNIHLPFYIGGALLASAALGVLRFAEETAPGGPKPKGRPRRTASDTSPA
jgi:MFS family permease